MNSTKPARTQKARRKCANQNTPKGHKGLPPEVITATAMVGVFERIARVMKKSPGHVRRVAHGERPSKAIIEAIVKEVRRVLAEAEAA